MRPLGPPDSFLVSAAEGWLELGNVAEACAELGQVAPELQNHPDVLDVRWSVCAAKADWAAALEVARALFHAAPDRPSAWLHRSYALRRAPDGSLEAAWQVLLPARQLFREHALIHYNLACYACQLGKMDDAKILLLHAFDVGNRERVKQLALADADLEPLWDKIRNW